MRARGHRSNTACLPSPDSPGGAGAIGKLTVGSLLTSSNLTLDFDLTTPSGSGDLLVVTGNLALAPNTAITFGADPTTYGDYPLIGYGSLTGSLSDLVLPRRPRTPGTRYPQRWIRATSTSWSCPSPPRLPCWASAPWRYSATPGGGSGRQSHARRARRLSAAAIVDVKRV